MRQLAEHRAEREQRDRKAEEECIREEAMRITKKNLKKLMQKAQNTSRGKTEGDDVSVEDSNDATRKLSRDRKPTDRYGAGASCNTLHRDCGDKPQVLGERER